MSIGLKRGTVLLEPHSDEWDAAAEEMIHQLKQILGDDAADVQHVGSTSIKNTVAKPIIDLAVAAYDFEQIKKHNEELAACNIVFRKEDVEGQMLYVAGDFENDIRTHHIHVVPYGSKAWTNYINFRDYLNAHPEKAMEYSELKQRLASQYADSRGEYTKNKQQMIDNLLQEAALWKNGL